ncbi:Cgl0159 family (beta/alpha)8-fold protein [Calidifontibacter terrae]
MTISDQDLHELTRRRARDPQAVSAAWAARRSRPVGERLLIAAADHPARASLGVRDRSSAMASRIDLLRRLAVALENPRVDGVLATADILEDLLLLGLLDNKLVIGSMNRGGLQGASFEFDDRFTGYTADAIAAHGLDGGKTLTRICLSEPATAATLESTAHAIDSLAAHRKLAIIEPFWSEMGSDGRARNLLTPDAVIRSIAVASGLGSTSAYTWLKVPVVADMQRVLGATTLPTLLLGGDPTGAPDDTYASWAEALTAPTAAGLVIGRALLYPPDGDVSATVDITARLVHGS